MKLFTISITLAVACSSQAQVVVPSTTFLNCTGGVGKQASTLILFSGGSKGGNYARIQQGSFDSGVIRIEEPSGMMMDDNRLLVDVVSQGRYFSFSYDAANPAKYNRLDYSNPARVVPKLPEFACKSSK
ncbi:MAG: hypothetical protein H7333_12225 [Bdellovibrionales bacterium]|nr:hypothetical protein [Oligoflexia bacterium]